MTNPDEMNILDLDAPVFDMGRVYKTRGGWDCVLIERCSMSVGSYYIFSHKKDFSNKSEGWRNWFLDDGRLKVWHKKNGDCREHNGCLSGEDGRQWDVVLEINAVNVLTE